MQRGAFPSIHITRARDGHRVSERRQQPQIRRRQEQPTQPSQLGVDGDVGPGSPVWAVCLNEPTGWRRRQRSRCGGAGGRECVCGLREWVCLCAACTRNRGWRAAARRDRSRTKSGNNWSEKRWMEHGAQSMDSPVWLPAQSPIQTGLARRERSDGATSKEGGRGAHMAMCSCSKHPSHGSVAAWQHGRARQGVAWHGMDGKCPGVVAWVSWGAMVASERCRAAPG